MESHTNLHTLSIPHSHHPLTLSRLSTSSPPSNTTLSLTSPNNINHNHNHNHNHNAYSSPHPSLIPGLQQHSQKSNETHSHTLSVSNSHSLLVDPLNSIDDEDEESQSPQLPHLTSHLQHLQQQLTHQSMNQQLQQPRLMSFNPSVNPTLSQLQLQQQHQQLQHQLHLQQQNNSLQIMTQQQIQQMELNQAGLEEVEEMGDANKDLMSLGGIFHRKRGNGKEHHCYKNTNLQEGEKDTFLRLITHLQYYVAQRLKYEFSSEIKCVDDYRKLSMQERMSPRDLVYENLHLVDEFLIQNPFQFSNDEIGTIERWRHHFVKGTFIVERHLQKGTIFITQEKDSEEKVYLVHGLEFPLIEILPKQDLPLVVRTVLLPFKGRIVYDGLFKQVPMVLSTSVNRSLKEIYMKVKQQDTIITTLADEPDDNKRRKRRKEDESTIAVDTKKLAMEISNSALQLKKTVTKGVESSAASVLYLTSQLMTKVLEDPRDKQTLRKHVKLLSTAINRLS